MIAPRKRHSNSVQTEVYWTEKTCRGLRATCILQPTAYRQIDLQDLLTVTKKITGVQSTRAHCGRKSFQNFVFRSPCIREEDIFYVFLWCSSCHLFSRFCSMQFIRARCIYVLYVSLRLISKLRSLQCVYLSAFNIMLSHLFVIHET